VFYFCIFRNKLDLFEATCFIIIPPQALKADIYFLLNQAGSFERNRSVVHKSFERRSDCEQQQQGLLSERRLSRARRFPSQF
jgi:hypothetical protein